MQTVWTAESFGVAVVVAPVGPKITTLIFVKLITLGGPSGAAATTATTATAVAAAAADHFGRPNVQLIGATPKQHLIISRGSGRGRWRAARTSDEMKCSSADLQIANSAGAQRGPSKTRDTDKRATTCLLVIDEPLGSSDLGVCSSTSPHLTPTHLTSPHVSAFGPISVYLFSSCLLANLRHFVRSSFRSNRTPSLDRNKVVAIIFGPSCVLPARNPGELVQLRNTSNDSMGSYR